MKPEATIMIPAHNAGKFLDLTLRSAITQTFSGNYEILIVNDGSTDSTGRIAEAFAQVNPRVRVLHQKNFGVGATRNRLLEEAKGNILLGLDADDLLNKTALESILSFYQRNPSVGFVYTDHLCIDEKGSVLYEGIKEGCHSYFDTLIYHLHFPAHLKAFRSGEVGRFRFDSSLRTGEDWDFILQMTPFVKKGHIPEFLYSYRLDVGVSSAMPSQINREITKGFLRKYVRNLYPGAKSVDVECLNDGENGIYYQHIVDGVPKIIHPKAREVLREYFSHFKQPITGAPK
jgi:glycosyltransferase involved in cell wall biosynthesis